MVVLELFHLLLFTCLCLQGGGVEILRIMEEVGPRFLQGFLLLFLVSLLEDGAEVLELAIVRYQVLLEGNQHLRLPFSFGEWECRCFGHRWILLRRWLLLLRPGLG